MSQNISVGKISIKNFKSLYDISFEPGNVNVFIGANGSGKSSVLEAIGILSAAISDRVNNNALQRTQKPICEGDLGMAAPTRNYHQL